MSGGGGGGDAFAEEPEAHENHERYLLTYADMITLLMALFIILFAIGQTDIAKFKRFQTGLQKEFGAPALDGGTGIVDGQQLDVTPSRVIALNYANPGLVNPDELGTSSTPGQVKKQVEITQYNADATAKTISDVLAESGLPKNGYEVDVDNRGVIIRLSTDNVTFASGSAALRSESNKSLDVVGRALALVSNEIIIEGHTDNRPMAPPVTNWELSALRASSVLRYFEDHFALDQAHLQVAGYADTRPIATNDTEEGRTRNRRVEIVLALHSDVPVPSNAAAVDPLLRDPAKPAAIDPLDVTAPSTTTTPAKTKK
jgi:chemotaxis protein MotB